MDMFREMVGRNGKYRIIDSHTSIKGQIEDMIAAIPEKTVIQKSMCLDSSIFSRDIMVTRKTVFPESSARFTEALHRSLSARQFHGSTHQDPGRTLLLAGSKVRFSPPGPGTGSRLVGIREASVPDGAEKRRE